MKCVGICSLLPFTSTLYHAVDIRGFKSLSPHISDLLKPYMMLTQSSCLQCNRRIPELTYTQLAHGGHMNRRTTTFREQSLLIGLFMRVIKPVPDLTLVFCSHFYISILMRFLKAH